MPRKKSSRKNDPANPLTGNAPKYPVVSADDNPKVNGDRVASRKTIEKAVGIDRDSTHGLPERRQKYAKAASTGGFGKRASNVTMSSGLNFFSPQLSTDFLELPQSLREKRELYEHFYKRDTFVGQGIDLLTELPLSRVTLGMPKCKDRKKAEEVLAFFRPMVDRLKLFQRIIEASREYNLMGNAFIFMEDDPNVELDEDGRIVGDPASYKGWKRIITLPIEQVRIESYNFGEILEAEYLPSEEEKKIVRKAMEGDPDAVKRAQRIPAEIRTAIEEARGVPLDTDPDSGSFLYHLARAKSQKEQLGTSVLERLLTTLVYRDKLRQAQTSIASRNMTPKRVVWAEGLNEAQVEELREQVDMALDGPDFTVVTNYQVEWNEIGVNDRLLDLQSEWERTTIEICTGLGLPREVISGEGSYSGNRIPTSIVNERFLTFREMIQTFVHDAIFKPIARRKGFVETDEWGNETLIFPPLKFTRMGLRDDQDTFSNLYNLYQKGSIPIDFILDLFNIDAEEVKDKLERDFATFNDPQFNEVIRGAFGRVGDKLAEDTDLLDKIIKNLNLTRQAPPDDEGGGGRFG